MASDLTPQERLVLEDTKNRLKAAEIAAKNKSVGVQSGQVRNKTRELNIQSVGIGFGLFKTLIAFLIGIAVIIPSLKAIEAILSAVNIWLIFGVILVSLILWRRR